MRSDDDAREPHGLAHEYEGGLITCPLGADAFGDVGGLTTIGRCFGGIATYRGPMMKAHDRMRTC